VWIVQIALKHPYTFIVMSLLIAIFGSLAAVRTPTDIFPNINIPVVSVVWTYTGLLPDDMSGRVVYYYERTLTAQVSDIEHIESQSLNSYGVIKIFFHKDVNIAAAVAQVTATSQTVLKLLPPGITPPYVLSYNASSVPILQLSLSSTKLPQRELFDQAQNFIRPQLATVEGAAVPSLTEGRSSRCRSISTNEQCRSTTYRPRTSLTPYPRKTSSCLPGPENRPLRLECRAQCQSNYTRPNQRPSGEGGQRHGDLHPRRCLRPRGLPPQTNVVRVDGVKAVLMTILKSGSVSTLDVIDGIKGLLPRIKETLPSSIKSACRG